MAKTLILILSLAMVITAATLGCSQRAATSEEAIKQAASKPNVEAQVDYLVQQANGFVNSQKFDDAINVAKHILSDLDQNSEKAKTIIETAKAEMMKLAQEKLDDAKQEANKAVDGMKGKIGNLGQ